jgi:tRNA A37 threonylcarbamoyladenosine biosynthesis protein TsaE
MRQHRRPASEQLLLHIDFYRLQGAAEAEGLGLEDWVGDPNVVAVVEWPERAVEVLPPERLWIRLDLAGESRRRLLFTPTGTLYENLLLTFRHMAFGV